MGEATQQVGSSNKPANGTEERPLARRREDVDWSELCQSVPWGQAKPSAPLTPAPEPDAVAPAAVVTAETALPEPPPPPPPKTTAPLAALRPLNHFEAFDAWVRGEEGLGTSPTWSPPAESKQSPPRPEPVARNRPAEPIEAVKIEAVKFETDKIEAVEITDPDENPHVEASGPKPIFASVPERVEPEIAPLTLEAPPPLAVAPSDPSLADVVAMVSLSIETRPEAGTVEIPDPVLLEMMPLPPVSNRLPPKPSPVQRPTTAKVPSRKAAVRRESILDGVLAFASGALKALTPTLTMTPAPAPAPAPVKRPAKRAKVPVSVTVPTKPPLDITGRVGREVGLVIQAVKAAGNDVLDRARSVAKISSTTLSQSPKRKKKLAPVPASRIARSR